MKKLIPILMYMILHAGASGQSFSASGQVIGWGTLNPTETLKIQGGLRYIPQFNAEIPLGGLKLEAEASVNAWGNTTYVRNDSTQYDANLTPYRIWVKLSGDQFEVRAGLQKINFGSASMLRPLMWFDRIDPRDPLQLTDGVYGLLGRYYFLNNANIWLWGLYGNNELKGLEQIPTKENSIEYGGRVQLPVFTGEVGLTYHHRANDPDQVLPAGMGTGEYFPENRYALDAKFDLGVGAWVEGTLTTQDIDVLPTDNIAILNAGLDYTFGLGTGLHVMGEGFWYMAGEDPFARDQEILFGGLSLNYNIGLIHSISGIVFYDFTNESIYRFINWSVTFDRWSFYTMAFWNPTDYKLFNLQQDAGLFSGAGFQLMAVFNY
jgi:hypothetical protein